MYALGRLSLSDVVQCSAALRRAGDDAGSLEATAGRVVRILREQLGAGDDDGPACALVRFYITMPFARLEPDLRRAARASAGVSELAADVTCLTLLASAGEEEAWNDRRRSQDHRAIPLDSAEAVTRLPMVHRLVTELGLSVDDVVDAPAGPAADAGGRSYDVFHVAEAVGSPYVPAQESFVVPYGVRSVLGFGGVLPSGALVAVILFSRVPVSAETAELFRPLAVGVRLAVLPFAHGPVFAHDPAVATTTTQDSEDASFAAAALRQLLEVSEATTVRQAVRLERALGDARRVARTLQDSLLPPVLPEVAGFELAARYHPAGDGSEIGGDFYDVFPLGEQSWIVALGDVCGKGVEAARLTALARYTLRAAATAGHVRGPVGLLQLLNRAIISQQPDEYCTLALAELEAGGSRLTVASGGHPFPLLVGADGGISEVGGPGGLVGLFPSVTFTERSVDLGPGDAVVLFTDGVTEARRDDDFFGDERVHHLLAGHHGRPAREMADALMAAVLDFQDGHASDDIALLVMRRCGDPPS